MAAFQWWLLLVGLVAGGGLVAVVTMHARRREDDLDDLEREAEANWIAERVHGLDRDIDGRTVATILRIHREYLSLPPPDQLVTLDPDGGPMPMSGGGDADGESHDIGDDGGSGADQHLTPA